jgi:hypothetical protein
LESYSWSRRNANTFQIDRSSKGKVTYLYSKKIKWGASKVVGDSKLYLTKFQGGREKSIVLNCVDVAKWPTGDKACKKGNKLGK